MPQHSRATAWVCVLNTHACTFFTAPPLLTACLQCLMRPSTHLLLCAGTAGAVLGSCVLAGAELILTGGMCRYAGGGLQSIKHESQHTDQHTLASLGFFYRKQICSLPINNYTSATAMGGGMPVSHAQQNPLVFWERQPGCSHHWDLQDARWVSTASRAVFVSACCNVCLQRRLCYRNICSRQK